MVENVMMSFVLQFYVRASDQRRVNEGVALANVTIIVTIDQPPFFVSSNNLITLPETSQIGRSVHTFVAQDTDLAVCIKCCTLENLSLFL